MPENFNSLYRDLYQNVDLLIGEKTPEEPAVAEFYNSKAAAMMLFTHIIAGSRIAIHTDVDMDGVGSCYILKNWLLACRNDLSVDCWINKKKQHGIDLGKSESFNHLEKKYDLIIILDSSTNELEAIKDLDCDVLVIDHHEVNIDLKELTGFTKGVNTRLDPFDKTSTNAEKPCKYVIINSLVDNLPNFKASDTMSAGLATYEFLRYFQTVFNLPNLLEEKKLYQWAVITLFTDKMNNDNPRNIYYVQKARQMIDKEPGLAQMYNSLNCKSSFLSKSDINFSLAPTFNTAIRAGFSKEALDMALREPNNVGVLKVYKEIQQEVLLDFDNNINLQPLYVTKDITGEGKENYSGLIAQKLLSKYNRTAIVYTRCVDDKNMVAGSFRGLLENMDYRQLLENWGYYAQGHKTAFGFRFPVDEVDAIMQRLCTVERQLNTQDYLTAGTISEHGKHHIYNIKEFQETGNLWKLGILNSIMSSDINIVLSKDDIKLKSVNDKGTYFTYDFNGVIVNSFEAITTEKAYMYVEHQDRLRIYLRNKYH